MMLRVVLYFIRHCGLDPQSKPYNQAVAFIHMVEIADRARNDEL
jgi:hypothetical protein